MAIPEEHAAVFQEVTRLFVDEKVSVGEAWDQAVTGRTHVRSGTARRWEGAPKEHDLILLRAAAVIDRGTTAVVKVAVTPSTDAHSPAEDPFVAVQGATRSLGRGTVAAVNEILALVGKLLAAADRLP